MKIFIDPGHGGRDSGAVGPTGTHESIVALKISNRLNVFLTDLGHKTTMSRFSDSFIPLSTRAQLANEWGADLFISVHCNAGGGIGFEAWTSPGQTGADPWATKLLESFHRKFPDRVYRKDLQDGDPDKEAKFTVLMKTAMPAVLFECGFIDHHQEEQWLVNNTQQIAEALANTFTQTVEPEQPEFRNELIDIDDYNTILAKLQKTLELTNEIDTLVNKSLDLLE